MSLARRPTALGLLAATLMAVIFSTVARGADGDGHYAIKGFGLSDCATFSRLHATKSADYEIFLIWIDGYVTARNEKATGTFDLLSWESPDLVAQIASQFCATNPDVRLAEVVRQIVDDLADQRLKSSSRLVAAQHGDQALLIYGETLLRVKAALADQGLYDGPMEPTFDEALKLSLRRFQDREGLPSSSLPDQVTLWKLLRPAAP